MTASAQGPHAAFLELVPRIVRHVSVTLGHLDAEALEEAKQEAIASAFVSYVRLTAKGKDPVNDFPSAMAAYAALQVKSPRRVGGHLNVRDVLAPEAQRAKGFRVPRIPDRPWHERLAD